MPDSSEIIKNSPEIWSHIDLTPAIDGHKYDRGHVAILGGCDLTGAACMAADAAMHIGAGLCSIMSQSKSLSVYKSFKPYIMVEEIDGLSDFLAHIKSKKRNSIVIGPGAGGVDDGSLCDVVINSLKLNKPILLDADVFSAFAGNIELLANFSHNNVVYTPHEGEYKKIFPKTDGDRIKMAIYASSILKGVFVLKGAETIIISRGKPTVIQKDSSPWLATAGAGDVLSGMISGLVAQNIPAYEASCMAVWIHSEVGKMVGVGLVATDIIDKMSIILKKIIKN